jgi:hypothetical protein
MYNILSKEYGSWRSDKGKATERWRHKATGAKAVFFRQASQLPGVHLFF